jgi:amidase
MTNQKIVAGLPFEDHVGAWVPHGHFTLSPTHSGVLSDLSFAAKDLYDVAGYVTGAGNPTWLETHEPAQANSVLIDQLLAAGATLCGKTLTDELAYSLQGENMHYGTPVNTRAPDRVPGGSSSGSAAAVAAGLVDFALATDTGGSTRVPGSYCGLWGLRTTHDVLSRQGVVPLSPKFDTMTWLAAKSEIFERVGQVLLSGPNVQSWRGGIVLTDACAEADPAFAPLMEKVVSALATQLSLPISRAPSSDTSLETWRQTYVTASAYDAWQTHHEWITAKKPLFSAAIDGRWKAAAAVTDEQVQQAQALQATLTRQIRDLLGVDRFAILPSASSAAISRTADSASVDRIRTNTFRITSIAGLSGLPQVNIPFIGGDGLPAGVSLLGPAGSDLALIHLAIEVGKITGALGVDRPKR